MPTDANDQRGTQGSIEDNVIWRLLNRHNGWDAPHWLAMGGGFLLGGLTLVHPFFASLLLPGLSALQLAACWPALALRRSLLRSEIMPDLLMASVEGRQYADAFDQIYRRGLKVMIAPMLADAVLLQFGRYGIGRISLVMAVFALVFLITQKYLFWSILRRGLFRTFIHAIGLLVAYLICTIFIAAVGLGLLMFYVVLSRLDKATTYTREWCEDLYPDYLQQFYEKQSR